MKVMCVSRLVLAALVLSGGLSACAPLVVGSAMMGSALMMADRRSTGAQVDDQAIEIKAATRLRERFGKDAHLNVTSYNRLVLITGEVATPEDLAKAKVVVESLDNVRSVVNEAQVDFQSSMSSRASDALLTSKVRVTLVDAKDLLANAFKIVTERGTVYLMGRVTAREAKRATDLARAIPGVKKVVQVFEVITEAELAELVPPAPKETPKAGE
jgi:osmotically-inducible protein OsmY